MPAILLETIALKNQSEHFKILIKKWVVACYHETEANWFLWTLASKVSFSLSVNPKLFIYSEAAMGLTVDKHSWEKKWRAS